jgi:DnaJ family protein B protein 4
VQNMGKDFYKTLGVSKTASTEDLKKAYRKLAMKWHPDRCPADKKDEAQLKFQEIGEAYETLSDPQKRKIYDQVGEEGIRMGASAADAEAYANSRGQQQQPGGFSGFSGGTPFASQAGPNGTTFHFTSNGAGGPQGGSSSGFSAQQAENIFRSFFGGSGMGGMGGMGGFGSMFGTDDEGDSDSGADQQQSHPHPQFRRSNSAMGGHGEQHDANFLRRSNSFGGPHHQAFAHGFPRQHHQPQQRQQTQAEPIHYPLHLSLEEIYNGCKKKVRITKRMFDAASGSYVKVAVDKEIDVKPGWKDGTKVTFEREGDEAPDVIPADIVFTVQSKPHPKFVRDGDDLVHTVDVTLADVFAPDPVRTTVTGLDNKNVVVESRNITPETVRIVPGSGMMNNKKRARGDLKVKYNIEFPDNLTSAERSQIFRILQNAAKRKMRGV